ncbi:MAE_28990/MAE_18760 family HEPN-like nuclease [Streptomyces sp. HPF1205]|uniref:MAE_28990/MAE_18760 family HEPN-like nuclease n=1 Tax=Streptomyces sp. HPF1205 TaxID=2873262 RepID=UPI001CEC5A9C|nr:MAE_28990/MAE_18760 family HEPN-like nuclease [Streptomyces sp. HPF1205]
MDAAQFVDKLDRQLARRKVELSNLLLMVKDENPDPGRLSSGARSAVVLAYAHWEGFVKQGSSSYVKFINAAQLRVSDLKFPLQAAYVSSAFKRASESSKSRYLGELLEEIDRRRNDIFSVAPEKCIDTESNLSSTVFKDVVKGVGLDVLPLYETRSIFIDQRIVLARNQVAHGELVSFDAVDVQDRISGVRLLIDSYATQLKDAVALGMYKKT